MSEKPKGSETTKEMLGRKLPWLLGKNFRIPRLRFPDIQNRAFALPTPPRTIAMIGIYIFLFFVMMGAVYLLTPVTGQDPMPALGADSNGNPVWFYPSISYAFIIESFVGAAIFFMGAIGFMALFESTKYSLNPSYGRKILVLGIIMVIVAFASMQYIMSVKSS
jgi:hypothetical protein